MKKNIFILFFLTIVITPITYSQSIARIWNEETLEAIRGDFARPTIHARNLFHTSLIMYDAWAVFDDNADTIFLGKTFGGFNCPFIGIETPEDIDVARHEVISFAMYRLLTHRFSNSPSSSSTLIDIEDLFHTFGYDESIITTDYSTNSYAALGNYLAEQIITFGMQDHSNEEFDYANIFYIPGNDAMLLEIYEEENFLFNPNTWQPLAFDVFIDQSGNPLPLNTPPFLSPEWGQVTPFALNEDDLEILNEGFDCYVYNDPGDPVYIQESTTGNGIEDPYKWHFTLVASWASHMDPNDQTMIDISPGAIGNFNIEDFPETFDEYKAFYNFTNGGDASQGHDLNPHTNAPYIPQLIKRSDYARVLAEFWADGPDSETPPGHWFTILNYVNDHPETTKKFEGQGDVLDDLEWDVKSYMALAGAMHDAAVNTWGIKGYYDYIRPISAIRYMAGKGQSSDPNLPSFDPHGIPLISGLIELVDIGDPLAGSSNENVGRIKIYSWKGPDFIANPDTDVAGVGWILGTHWWSYQRGTFVTPPFAGYLSGHSTFSRAAAEVLTLITGDAFFPGGMGNFEVTQNDFLIFEEGPTESFTLQWATYRDASDQTSLSRIWGGIHPPIDDIRGRVLGAKIGLDAFNKAKDYYNAPEIIPEEDDLLSFYPVPFENDLTVSFTSETPVNLKIYNITGTLVYEKTLSNTEVLPLNSLSTGVYFAQLFDLSEKELIMKKILKK